MLVRWLLSRLDRRLIIPMSVPVETNGLPMVDNNTLDGVDEELHQRRGGDDPGWSIVYFLSLFISSSPSRSPSSWSTPSHPLPGAG